MRKIIFMFVALLSTMTANAQFEEGTGYVGTSLTGAGLSYNGAEDFNLGIQAKAGYFISDGLMLNALVGLEHKAPSFNALTVGAGARYYVVDNGLFIGAGAKLLLANNHNDVMPNIELGWAFYISENLAIEPSVTYDQSFSNHSDYSTVGLRIGLGYFF